MPDPVYISPDFRAPAPPSGGRWSLAAAKHWCRAFASSYYENFTVASYFLPRDKRDEYFALYAFARGADQLADDWAATSPEPERSRKRIEALEQWSKELRAIYDGILPSHPAFIALRPVIEHHEIEQHLFSAMIDAFIADQTKARFASWEEVRNYTCGSADPVGRWVLRLYDHHDAKLDRYSDSICTGLQLTNFLQDIRSDLVERDRIYIPQPVLQHYEIDEDILRTQPTHENVKHMLKQQVVHAESLLEHGKPLLELVSPALKKQLMLFHGGGRLALHAIRSAGYDVASHHLKVSKAAKFSLLIRVLRGVPL